MALFDAGSLASQGTTVTDSITQVFSTSPGGTALTSPAGVVVLNQGPADVLVGAGTVTTTGGVLLSPGQELYVSGTAQNLYAITYSDQSASVISGLATVAAVV